LSNRDEITLVYVSGRNKKLVEQAISCYQLPRPELVVSDVGTRIHDLRSGDWQACKQWESEISPDWFGRTGEDLQQLFHDLKALRLQEHDRQGRFKLSYNVSLHEDREQLMQLMQQRLRQHSVRASLTWSVDDPAGMGLLDVTPRSATKLHAVEFIRTRLGFSYDETIFAGDSGNDLPVLAGPIQAVLVANATRTVREEALREATRNGTMDAIYCAAGNEFGNGNYSSGIIEGIMHYRPEVRSWLKEQG
jgi:HAD superfamily hydrolase (TIGR01484 family)